MADFTLTIADADVARVTTALCSPFNLSYNSPGIDFTVTPPNPVSAKDILIEMLKIITVQVETAAAQAAIVAPDMS